MINTGTIFIMAAKRQVDHWISHLATLCNSNPMMTWTTLTHIDPITMKSWWNLSGFPSNSMFLMRIWHGPLPFKIGLMFFASLFVGWIQPRSIYVHRRLLDWEFGPSPEVIPISYWRFWTALLRVYVFSASHSSRIEKHLTVCSCMSEILSYTASL